MRHYSRNYNSLESRRKRSEKARHAVSCRKDRQLENREPRQEPPPELFEIIVRNKISGKETLVEINKGNRSNNFTFLINGELWKVCGIAKAEGLILSSLARAQRESHV